VQVAGRNLLAVLAMRQASYADAAKAYNSLPEADRGAAEPTPEVKAALDKVNVEADGLIDVAARFVAFATVKNLPQSTRDRVFGLLENVYKTRHPEDATGLQALVDEKVKALGGGSGDLARFPRGMVRRASVRQRGRVQALRRELPRPRASRADPDRGAGARHQTLRAGIHMTLARR